MTSISDTAYYYNPNDNKFHPIDLSTEKTIEDTGWNTPVIPISKSANSSVDETGEHSNYYEIMGFCSPNGKAETAKDQQVKDAAINNAAEMSANKLQSKESPGIIGRIKSFFGCGSKVTNKTDEE